ncbi:hypothetical protein LTR70_007448 [Exophiala xenobiotica]|uniref:PNPLA domain-containing protein n=1 Tax=Lithohypha guttulata TaxID=1690604 RepID=A0ABR0K4H1_9EURO|nr:hypothetical protein LTR24_006988 [Lithohypha guttulata]KAK5313805.1 hypothetical protein LTR70_007448 [Exophiala xenobiotica]
MADEPLIWGVARVTIAALGYLRPKKIKGFGLLQDGGLRANNPIEAGLWELGSIWPGHARPGLVLSVGTGYQGSPAHELGGGQGVTSDDRETYPGSDGVHSQVRHSLNIPMEGDSTNAAWAGMDVFPRTNFPDVRKKRTIRSEHGTLMIIPREGDRMIRTYFEMPHGTNPKQVQLGDLHKMAQKLFQPYKIDFFPTRWWSAYSIGQRLARDMIDDSGHIFLAGDACHTHSPKAGLGMNASLQDGYNMGRKLGPILIGQADKKILRTYNEERQQYARQLMEFDRYFAKLFSSTTDEISADAFNQASIKSGNLTAGMAANYKDSDLTSSQQDLVKRIIVGERMPTAQIVRKSDSKALQLQRLLQFDGRVARGHLCW